MDAKEEISSFEKIKAEIKKQGKEKFETSAYRVSNNSIREAVEHGKFNGHIANTVKQSFTERLKRLSTTELSKSMSHEEVEEELNSNRYNGFAAALQRATEFGLLSPDEINDLTQLNLIRNKFDKNPRIQSYDDPVLAEFLNKLRIYKKFSYFDLIPHKNVSEWDGIEYREDGSPIYPYGYFLHMQSTDTKIIFLMSHSILDSILTARINLNSHIELERVDEFDSYIEVITVVALGVYFSIVEAELEKKALVDKIYKIYNTTQITDKRKPYRQGLIGDLASTEVIVEALLPIYQGYVDALNWMDKSINDHHIKNSPICLLRKVSEDGQLSCSAGDLCKDKIKEEKLNGI